MFKSLIQKKLENYVKKYFKAHPNIKLVAITGSVGKTTTKVAIATVLSEKYNVRYNEGNHNAQMSVPLAILGVEYPINIRSLKQWLMVFKQAKAKIKRPDNIDIIVQELGTDHIGEIEHFGSYLHPDISVVTAVAPEHMEFFKSIDNVAKEELAVSYYSNLTLINRDDIDGQYAKYISNSNISTYGIDSNAEYNFINQDYGLEEGYKGQFIAPNVAPIPVNINVLGEYMLRPAIVAGAVALNFGMSSEEISKGISKVSPIPGRMNILRGMNNTTIIDDSYNSSPLAAMSALRTLYQINSPQRIAVLGDMNELGDVSDAEHKALGEICSPSELAWVVTVGSQMSKNLVPVVKAKGCQVKEFTNAIDAGAFVHSVMEPGAVVLFKGSQGGIFLEEAIKIVLHSVDDEKMLVRQSEKWLKQKNDWFSKFKQS